MIRITAYILGIILFCFGIYKYTTHDYKKNKELEDWYLNGRSWDDYPGDKPTRL